jgi:hypothetical protein
MNAEQLLSEADRRMYAAKRVLHSRDVPAAGPADSLEEVISVH